MKGLLYLSSCKNKEIILFDFMSCEIYKNTERLNWIQLDKEKSVENNGNLLDQYSTLNPINALSAQFFFQRN